MGVHGLSRYMDHNCHQTTKKCLRDTAIVIDGNNLMYYLYSTNTVTNVQNFSASAYLFGGDYLGYAQRIRHFLQHLKLCGIQPYFIFDGAYEPPPELHSSDSQDPKVRKITSNKLQKTSLLRFRKVIRDNVRYRRPGKSYSPVLMQVHQTMYSRMKSSIVRL